MKTQTKFSTLIVTISLIALVTTNCFSQCSGNAFIKVDGNTILAYTATPGDPIQIALPLWLKVGQTLAVDLNVFSISVLEFTINGTSLDFSQGLNVTTIQTVPSGKMWKVESLLRQSANLVAVGQYYEGGIVVFASGCPQHGIISATSDQSSGVQWFNGSSVTTGASGLAIGTGQANTTAIISAQGAGTYAASVCHNLTLNGYTDWYLPSRDELNQMYVNKAAVGGFAADSYWSSSEYDATGAFHQYFYDGSQYYPSKGFPYYVRCVRAF
jgi:hypothetical protein